MSSSCMDSLVPPGGGRRGAIVLPSREGLGRVVCSQRGMGRYFGPLRAFIPPQVPLTPAGGTCGGIGAMGGPRPALALSGWAPPAPHREKRGRLHSASGGSKAMPAALSLAWPLKAFLPHFRMFGVAVCCAQHGTPPVLVPFQDERSWSWLLRVGCWRTEALQCSG